MREERQKQTIRYGRLRRSFIWRIIGLPTRGMPGRGLRLSKKHLQDGRPAFPKPIDTSVRQSRGISGEAAVRPAKTGEPEEGVRNMKSPESDFAESQIPLLNESQKAVILGQLTRIQNSHAFGNSDRAKHFLAYVVEHTLQDHTEVLKERTIGVKVFQRAPAYATGDDAIVRVNAAEVRRRLFQYYAEEEQAPEVRIELPVGSYIPKFHWMTATEATRTPGRIPVVERGAVRPRLRVWRFAAVAAVLAIVGTVAVITMRKHSQQKSQFDEFWAPVFATPQPVLICAASPVAYELDGDLYARAGRASDSQVEQTSTPLQLEPDTPLKWKEVYPVVDYLVNKDDAYVAAELTGLFARIHKTSQVRIGRDSTYEDLRNSPAVLIGAFNNPWTIRMTSDLPIGFTLRSKEGYIEEKGGQGRIWHTGVSVKDAKDIALVARLVNSKTGQFLVIIGGIGMVGTQAAGAFVSQPDELEAALRSAPAGWQQKNVEVVLESDVIDGSASTPRVVAVKTW